MIQGGGAQFCNPILIYMAFKTRIWIWIFSYMIYMQGARNTGYIEVQIHVTGAWRPIIAMNLNFCSTTKNIEGNSQKWTQMEVDCRYHCKCASNRHKGATQIFRSNKLLVDQISSTAGVGIQAGPSSRINWILMV